MNEFIDARKGDQVCPEMPEPFKIKVIERITLPTRQKRKSLIEEASYNVFMLKAKDVFIDLLTDSGTSAMSDHQWAGMFETTQSYAGSQSYFTLGNAMEDIFGFKYWIPVHQGRAAENILFSTIIFPGCYVPSNTHFDTTEANIVNNKGIPVNLVIEDAYDPKKMLPFKGNMDINKLEAFIKEKTPRKIPLVMITITNNGVGGQPVSMQNIKEVSEIARKYQIPFFIDACRFAENCYLIKQREAESKDKTLKEIARTVFSYADGCTFSGKKDALTNIGGMLCTNNEELYTKFTNMLITIEGFLTYGGLACRDLEAMARGLYEAIDEDYQAYRHKQMAYLAKLLKEGGVPIYEPVGSHAIYIDSRQFLPHIPPEQFPDQALTAQLYLESGVRVTGLGSSAFGKIDEKTGRFIPSKMELVRLAIPRRVYTNNHLRYVAECIIKLYHEREKIRGLRRTYTPKALPHFTSRFEIIDKKGETNLEEP
jgi:tryptophanase